MFSIILTITLAFSCFVAGVYYEKGNSIRKVKPVKKAFSSINKGRTIVVDRTNK